jgi:hypothetical protein
MTGVELFLLYDLNWMPLALLPPSCCAQTKALYEQEASRDVVWSWSNYSRCETNYRSVMIVLCFNFCFCSSAVVFTASRRRIQYCFYARYSTTRNSNETACQQNASRIGGNKALPVLAHSHAQWYTLYKCRCVGGRASSGGVSLPFWRYSTAVKFRGSPDPLSCNGIILFQFHQIATSDLVFACSQQVMSLTR